MKENTFLVVLILAYFLIFDATGSKSPRSSHSSALIKGTKFFKKSPKINSNSTIKIIFSQSAVKKHFQMKNISCPFVNVTADNVFLHSVSCIGPRHHSNIIFFNGQKVKSVFDLDNNQPHIPLHLKLKVKRWSDLSLLINETRGINSVGVHIHNELTFGDLMMLINLEYIHTNKKNARQLRKFMATYGSLNLSASDIRSLMDNGQPPVVFTNTADENWGFLSTSKHGSDDHTLLSPKSPMPPLFP